MANQHRGEIEARLDGKTYNLCLTLGALAELENAFGDDDMLALAERFGSGRISAKDATKVIAAGLRGGGHDIDEQAVALMRGDGGAAGFVDIVARLLAATFGGPIGTAIGEVVVEGVKQAIGQKEEKGSAGGRHHQGRYGHAHEEHHRGGGQGKGGQKEAAVTRPFPGTK